jgi:hypothetical protein
MDEEVHNELQECPTCGKIVMPDWMKENISNQMISMVAEIRVVTTMLVRAMADTCSYLSIEMSKEACKLMKEAARQAKAEESEEIGYAKAAPLVETTQP